MASGVDDFEARIAKSASYNSGAPVMAVQARFGNQYTKFPRFFHGNLPP
jgi:hypothetical protein